MRVKLLLASSNPGKLREYCALASQISNHHEMNFEIELLPGFAEILPFPEDAPTFAENAAGKALYYCGYSEEMVFADDSGLVVPALGGAPGVRSARYAGENASDAQRNAKLLREVHGKAGAERNAKFVCVIASAKRGKMLAVVSDFVEGTIVEKPSGAGGFGYDPVFYYAAAEKTLGELSEAEKNTISHRGKAFRRLCEALRGASR